MTVITEEIIRKKIRIKELVTGSIFQVQPEDIITPSATSYLREQQISLKKSVKRKIEQAKNYAEISSGQELANQNICDELILSELKNELLKMRNFLFFPQIADGYFSSENWLYFEQQQNWLMSFRACVGSEKSCTQPEQAKPIKATDYCRAWQFCCNEIFYQINYLLILFNKNKELISPNKCALFYAWSQELLKVLKIEES